MDETWAILKNYINSLEKCRCRKVCSLITPTFLNQFLFWQRSCAVCPLVQKYEESIKNLWWNMQFLQNYFNFFRKMYEERSVNKASTQSMSSCEMQKMNPSRAIFWAILKNYFNSLEKCRCRKVCSLITPIFLNQFLFWQRSQVVQYVLLSNAKV